MDQLSLLPDLDRASDTRKPNLCRTWENALENDCWVLVENRHDFTATEGKKVYPRIVIKCALVYPNVYYNFTVETIGSGKSSPVDRDYSPNFDVHECAANVMLMVEHHLRDYINIEFRNREKLINNVLEQMREGITEVK